MIPLFITMLSSLSPIPLPVTFVVIRASLPGPLYVSSGNALALPCDALRLKMNFLPAVPSMMFLMSGCSAGAEAEIMATLISICRDGHTAHQSVSQHCGYNWSHTMDHRRMRAPSSRGLRMLVHETVDEGQTAVHVHATSEVCWKMLSAFIRTIDATTATLPVEKITMRATVPHNQYLCVRIYQRNGPYSS